MLTLQITGQEQAEGMLDMLGMALDPVDMLDEAAALLLNRIRTRFLAETDTLGVKWVPSFASQMRASTGRGGGTLYNTGNLFRSIQVFADSSSSRLIGTDVEYAEQHQLGLNGNLKREFIGASEEDANMMLKLVLRRIEKAIK